MASSLPILLLSVMLRPKVLCQSKLSGTSLSETGHGLMNLFASDLIALGKVLGMKVECAVTRADEPIGSAIGPILEAKECISVLENGGLDDAVTEKACGIAGMLLEMSGRQNGNELAHSILSSGKAHSKFIEIVAAQGGSPDLRSEDLTPGKHWKDVHAKRSGYVQFIDNAGMTAIAKGAGAPSDKGAGVLMFHKKGDFVNEGETLFRIYAENQAKLDRSVDSARSRRPMYVSPEKTAKSDGNPILRTIVDL